MNPSIAAIICAAGSSSRMGGVKKEYLPLEAPPGKEPLSVLASALRAFYSFPQIDPIIITIPEGEERPDKYLSEDLRPGEGNGRVFYCTGGPNRRSSVHRALAFLETFKNPQGELKASHVLIHDGARPWIKKDLIEKIIAAVLKHGAVIPALPLTETPKELSGELIASPVIAHSQGGAVSPGGAVFPGAVSPDPVFIKDIYIQGHLRRSRLCTAQTPQAFAFPEILISHKKAEEREKRDNHEYTDDAEIWGEFSGPVAVIPGDPDNKKITYPEDIKICKE